MNLTSFSATTWGPVEKAILSALVHDFSGSERDRILDELKPSDFFLTESQKLFSHLASEIESGRPIDTASLLATCSDSVTRNIIIDITGTIPSTSSQIDRHIEKLKELSRLRSITRAIEEAKQKLEHGEPSIEIATGLETAMREVETDSDSQALTIAECADRALEGVRAAMDRGCLYSGIPSGMERLDRICGGWQAGQLIGLAARTGEGKTALALQFALHAARNRWDSARKEWDGKGHCVVMVELEMSARELGHRAMAHLDGPPMWKMRDGSAMTDFDKVNLAQSRGRLDGLSFFVDDPPRIRLSELRARARRWRKRIGMELLIVDLLGKVSPDQKERDRYREVAVVSHGLKALAKELGIPVMAVCQLNRDSVGDGEAGLHHLRESGDIEQDVDVAILLTKKEDDTRKLRIAKNRNGFLGLVDLGFDGDHQRFCEIVPEAK
jgi:replicative DNA helicase